MASELSVLIPVYNYFIFSLVQELHSQCSRAGILFEIICLDDASDDTFKTANRAVKTLEKVVYEELPVNISRSAIRNQLAFKAHYSYLLFLDNDSEIIAPDYILRYLRQANPQQVLIGGTVYSGLPPATKYTLHWQVGRHREQKPAVIRNRHPYRNVHVNNALVPLALFIKYTFDETITRYGHEDSQWAHQLQLAGVIIYHLDNPVRHGKLETTEVYLIKSKEAVQNLFWLYKTQGVGADTKLIRMYNILYKWHLIGFCRRLLKVMEPWLLQKLHQSQPPMWAFDAWKLGKFLRQK